MEFLPVAITMWSIILLMNLIWFIDKLMAKKLYNIRSKACCIFLLLLTIIFCFNLMIDISSWEDLTESGRYFAIGMVWVVAAFLTSMYNDEIHSC